MNYLKITAFTIVLSLAGCISWVFAKSPFNDMPEGQYVVDLSHASIVWKVSHLGLSNYVARFADFDASIEYDPSGFSATTTIKRTEWGMGKYAPNIGDEVAVMIEGEFVKTDD